jgi:hypothetical protein
MMRWAVDSRWGMCGTMIGINQTESFGNKNGVLARIFRRSTPNLVSVNQPLISNYVPQLLGLSRSVKVSTISSSVHIAEAVLRNSSVSTMMIGIISFCRFM